MGMNNTVAAEIHVKSGHINTDCSWPHAVSLLPCEVCTYCVLCMSVEPAHTPDTWQTAANWKMLLHASYGHSR